MLLSLGQIAVLMALLFAALAFVSFLLATVRRDTLAARAARDALLAAALALTVALATLLAALLTHDFSIDYVARYSDLQLPAVYAVTALWAGPEGSLLFWTALAAVIMVAVVAKGALDRWRAVCGAALTAVLLLLLVILHLDPQAVAAGDVWPLRATPFLPGEFQRIDGHGLGLMLQTPAMILHPPTLFAGYALLAMPFAVALANFVTGRLTARLDLLRRFLLLGWTFLTIGNALGAWWAYIELGWGGYWAWDPVENASLIPWLVATAALHCLAVTRRTGRLAATTLTLAAAAFLACLLATYITRSGVVSSVHAYAAPEAGPASLLSSLLTHGYVLFIAMAALVVAALAFWRRPGSRPSPDPLDRSSRGRVAVALLPAVLLLAFAFGVLEGTVGPTLRSHLTGYRYGLETGRFDLLAAVFGLAVLAALSIYPYLAVPRSRRGTLVLVAIQLASAIAAVTVLLAVAPDLGAWMIVTFALAAAVLLGQAWTARAAWRSLGGAMTWLSHLAILIIAVAVAGSHVIRDEQTVALAEGQTATFAGYTVQLESVTTDSSPHQSDAVTTARLLVTRDGRPVTTLEPALRSRPAADQSRAEVAVRTGLAEDLYASLGSHQSQNGRWPITLHRTALMLWLWIGAALLSVAGLVAAFRRYDAAATKGGQP